MVFQQNLGTVEYKHGVRFIVYRVYRTIKNPKNFRVYVYFRGVRNQKNPKISRVYVYFRGVRNQKNPKISRVYVYFRGYVYYRHDSIIDTIGKN